MTSYWHGLSVREKFLALVTGSVLASAVVFFGVYRAVGELDRLDRRIVQLEDELINLMQQEARSASAEIAFREMAAEHSSAWTKEEIQDRLRQEIYRLALFNLDTRNPTQKDYMVRINRLPPGELNTEPDGYREFRIAFNLEPTSIVNVLRFVERLQKSPQSLRVTSLDLRRRPSDPEVAAFLSITRTVLDSDPDQVVKVAAASNLLGNGGFEKWDDDTRFPNWQAPGCEVAQSKEHATEGEWCLEAIASDTMGQVYQTRNLPGGYSYRLSVDIAADGPVSLGVADEETGEALDGAVTVESDGQVYRYELVFTPPDDTRSRPLQAPLITLEREGTKVFLDNARLERLEADS